MPATEEFCPELPGAGCPMQRSVCAVRCSAVAVVEEGLDKSTHAAAVPRQSKSLHKVPAVLAVRPVPQLMHVCIHKDPHDGEHVGS